MPGLPRLARAGRRLLVLMALVASACDDSSSPPPRIDITLENTIVEGPTITGVEDGTNEVACRVSIAAIADGAGVAVWDSGAFLFYGGRNRTVPLDTVPLSAAKLSDYWEAAEIGAGELQHFQIKFTAPWGFGIGVVMHYHAENGGAKGSASTEFDCGPRIPANSQPPNVTAVSVEPPGTVEPGKPMVVTYTASSDAGLLRTAVRLSGACTLSVTVPELLNTTVTRSVTVHVPGDCRLDQQLTVTVVTTDAASEQGSRSMTVALADLTAPTVAPFFYRPNGRAVDRDLAGEYFIGDSLNMSWGATDNVLVTALIWGVPSAGIRDSMLVRGGAQYYRIPIRADWPTGPVQLRLSARDSVGHESAPYLSAPNALTVFPSVTRPSKSIALGGEVSTVTIDAPRGLVYVLQPEQRQVVVLPLASMVVTRTIPLPSTPGDMDLSAGGDSLIVTLPQARALAVINLADAGAPVTTLALTMLDAAGEQRPSRIRVASNGKALISVTSTASGGQTVAEVDFTTGVQRMRPEWNGGGFHNGPLSIERSHDRSTVLLATVRYDAATGQFSPPRSVGFHPLRPSLDATGNRIAFGRDVYDASLQLVRRVNATSGFDYDPTALSPGGEYLYTVSTHQGIIRSRVSDGATLDRIPDPIDSMDLVVAADGSYIVTIGGTTLSAIAMR